MIDNLTFGEILAHVEKTESHVWSEYLQLNDQLPDLPVRYRWISVFVVTGGSEGLYLHVEFIYPCGCRKLVIVGKSLDSSRENWKRCWESAGRIAEFLGA